MSAIQCPKCRADMTSYERNGVNVDSCRGCGGLFLDRGELEHLIQAEAAFYSPSSGSSASARSGFDHRERPDRHEEQYQPRYDERHHSGPYGRKKKKRGFLDDLLDF